jgi:hypothetical protein
MCRCDVSTTEELGLHIEEAIMPRYELVSGVVFTVVALAQATRALLGWPAQVDGVSIPVWVSAVAFLITGTLAVWAFRSGRSLTA